MSKATTVQAPSPLRAFWLKWRFHINILLLLVPLGFMPKYFADVALFRGDAGLGEREVGEVQVGPWSITLAELRNEAPRPDPAGPMKSFNAALCATCGDQVKATYLRIGKPRSLRAAGVIFDFLRHPVPHGRCAADPGTHPARRRTVDHHGRLGRQHAAGLHSLESGFACHRRLVEQARS